MIKCLEQNISDMMRLLNNCIWYFDCVYRFHVDMITFKVQNIYVIYKSNKIAAIHLM